MSILWFFSCCNALGSPILVKYLFSIGFPSSVTAQMETNGKSEVCILQCTLYTAHFTLYTLHFALCTAHCTLHTSHCTLHTLHCTLYTLHFALHTAHCTLQTAEANLCNLYTALYTAHCTHYTVHSTLNAANCTLQTAHCILHTANCTLHRPLYVIRSNWTTETKDAKLTSNKIQCKNRYTGNDDSNISDSVIFLATLWAIFIIRKIANNIVFISIYF